MPPKMKPVDSMPKTPRKNARDVMPDPVDPDVVMTEGAGATYELNQGLEREVGGSVEMLNLRELAGHLEISETELSVNCCARCLQRYDQVLVPVCDSIFDADGTCLHKCGYCSQQKGDCVRIGLEVVPLANLVVAVRENFENDMTEKRMNELKFLCERFRVARQVFSRRKPESGPSWPVVSSLTKEQSENLASIAQSLKSLVHILKAHTGTTDARPTYTVGDVLEKFGWVPRRKGEKVARNRQLNSRIVGAATGSSQDAAARRARLQELAAGRVPRASGRGGTARGRARGGVLFPRGHGGRGGSQQPSGSTPAPDVEDDVVDDEEVDNEED